MSTVKAIEKAIDLGIVAEINEAVDILRHLFPHAEFSLEEDRERRDYIWIYVKSDAGVKEGLRLLDTFDKAWYLKRVTEDVSFNVNLQLTGNIKWKDLEENGEKVT